MNYDALMKKARKTNESRDKEEEQVGYLNPSEGLWSMRIATAISAIECGIKVNDWNAVAEGQAMLEKLVADVREAEGGSWEKFWASVARVGTKNKSAFVESAKSVMQ
jgi:hypothetical protein